MYFSIREENGKLGFSGQLRIKIHRFVIDFQKEIVYDKIASYGIPINGYYFYMKEVYTYGTD